MNPLHDFPNFHRPFRGGLPKKLTVGEQFNFYLTFKHEHLRDDPLIDVGFNDVFGGHHWASRKDVWKVRVAIKEGVPKAAAD
ncbi:MAG: hypothetical protein K0R27_3937 [Xanthobacteraceae bacterium]|nr:hypothetical protein [Xanthobacteraceae bacterium]